MCINFAWLRWLPMNQASLWPPMLFWFFWTDENANLGTAMRYEEIGETMWFSLPWFLVFKSVLACHFESSSENTEFAQGEKKLTAYFSSGKYKQHQIRQRQPNSCLRNRQSKSFYKSCDGLSILWRRHLCAVWCLILPHGENVACFFFILSKLLCLPPQRRENISLLCLVCFMVWCVTVVVVCSELRILLLCGSDLLESFCIPGLWNESDVRYNSFSLSLCFLVTNF